MKSTNNAQTTEAMDQKAIASNWQDCIVEELSDETASAFRGGWKIITAASTKPISLEEYYKLAGFWGG
ncbi:hypothetical protein H6G17_23115 [Chroococcidiopsis sp. FACHB-1243]|uniref:hypothetical protein n=1 Tax=Chroococcidiopsis sp. [FACHB-1243] TaxID=2692781 RepID=UPI00177B90C8|nr:hypothetical protein [Chroococcidiopsis sp. [FACHB-1243]]MBD2308370.1 hypothetical protein [Chroococcidiopsis sp. [FACHB-1243]]